MTMLDDDTIKPYCPSLLRGKSDKIKLSQILREMRLSDLCQMKRFRRPRKWSLHTLLTNLSNAFLVLPLRGGIYMCITDSHWRRGFIGGKTKKNILGRPERRYHEFSLQQHPSGWRQNGIIFPMSKSKLECERTMQGKGFTSRQTRYKSKVVQRNERETLEQVLEEYGNYFSVYHVWFALVHVTLYASFTSWYDIATT